MILSWYRQNASDFGMLRATSLLLRVVWRRAIVKARNALLPTRVECPCCGWVGNRFLDYKEMGYSVRNIECPRCGSHSRHRGFFLWLRNDYQIADKSGTAIVFAPEKALASLWTSAQGLQIFGVDIEPTREVDVLADLMHLPFVDDVANIIWCHHVLEQVTDDHQAMIELRRVLKSQTGQLILSAGLSGELFTREFGRSDKGLSGNRRSYGADIAERLTEAGFVLKQASYGLEAEAMTKHAIRDEPFYVCRKGLSEV
jgi:SAM-dependent methyltransferase